ncbi:MAG: EAL domain-containing protein [Acidobacteria bacterium]|nr:EAL domain-containing protein [Acidobacteriota bacterium]
MSSIHILGSDKAGCARCSDGSPPINFEFAFQPIVSVRGRRVVAYEALARGPLGEPAATVLSQLNSENRFRFDQDCRTKAIESAAALGMSGALSINFIPNAVANPRACIRRTLETAAACGFNLSKIVLELTESEQVEDPESLVAIFREYKKLGIKTAIDDFGAGYAGLNLLSRFQPDVVKIDIALVRDVDSDEVKQVIVEAIVQICDRLSIVALAEGVETARERDYLLELGVDLMQGFLFARPTFKSLGSVDPRSFSPEIA